MKNWPAADSAVVICGKKGYNNSSQHRQEASPLLFSPVCIVNERCQKDDRRFEI